MDMRCLLIILSIICGFQVKAQDSTSTFVSAGAHFGYIIPHAPAMSHLIRGHSYGGYVRLMKQVSGAENWHSYYGLPTHGTEFYYSETGNPTQLGKQLALSYIISLGLNKQESYPQHYHHFLNLGLGMGYATKKWDFEENRQAIALGSRLNAALTLHYEVHTLKGIYFGFRLTHLSNGAFQLPNLGTNTFSTTLRFQPSKAVRRMNERELSIHHAAQTFRDRKWSSSFAFAIGAKEVPPLLGRKFLTGSLTYVLEKRITAKSSIGFGADVFHNSSLKILLAKKESYNNTVWQASQLGALLSYTLHFGKVQLKIQQGVYAYSLWTDYGLFYQRVGLRYYVSDRWYASLNLKTHFAKADYGELGIGYTWPRK